MRGIGNRSKPIQLPELWYVIVYPGIVLHTRDVYEGLKIPLTLAQMILHSRHKLSTAFDIARTMENDLEEDCFFLCPQIQTVKEDYERRGHWFADEAEVAPRFWESFRTRRQRSWLRERYVI